MPMYEVTYDRVIREVTVVSALTVEEAVARVKADKERFGERNKNYKGRLYKPR